MQGGLAAFDVYDTLKASDGWEIITRYVGPIDEGIVSSALEGLDGALAGRCQPSYARKVYSILVEDLQNLYHHADYYPTWFICPIMGAPRSFGSFCIGFEGEECQILTGNFVSRAQMLDLRYRIDVLNAMEPEAVRIRSRTILNNQSYSSKGGGGLGLVDMLRKARHPLRYSFVQVEDDYYFYTLLVSVENA